MGCSRQGTKLEGLVNTIVSAVRSLDKLTWHNYDKVKDNADILLEETDYLQNFLNQFIAEVKYQKSIPSGSSGEPKDPDDIPEIPASEVRRLEFERMHRDYNGLLIKAENLVEELKVLKKERLDKVVELL